MSHVANKIDAEDKKLYELFSDKRYKIDAFQREYRWRRTHVEAMISDLYMSFARNYVEGATLADVSHYDCYYMGPIVLCDEGVQLSVIDGQQRLTTITLLFIYMMHLQESLDIPDDYVCDLRKYIITKKAGMKTYVLDVAKRNNVMKSLIQSPGNDLVSNLSEEDLKDESVINILARYDDINALFPEQLKSAQTLPCFIEWLLYRVVMVQITAYSTDNAYTIFETMNDRGMTLNPTEILKALILSKIEDESQSEEMNELWKRTIAQLKSSAGYEGDMAFFRAWFRAKYAETVRAKTSGAENEDFELIGTQFHTWFKNNFKKLGIRSSKDYYYFVKSDMDFFSSVFIKIVSRVNANTTGYELYHVLGSYPMADSLYYPLLMASVSKDDGEDDIDRKLDMVNCFVDSYINIRTLSHKTITQSSIRYSIYDMIKEIRGVSIEKLGIVLREKYKNLRDLFEASVPGYLFSFNGSYMHYFLSRELYDKDNTVLFDTLLRSRKRDSYVIARIFELDMLDEPTKAVVQPIYDSLANFCLIRRYDYYNLSTLNLQTRLAQLSKYLPELDNNVLTPERVLESRNSNLRQFAVEEWL